MGHSLDFFKRHGQELGWELSPYDPLFEAADDLLSPHALNDSFLYHGKRCSPAGVAVSVHIGAPDLLTLRGAQ